MTAFDKHCTEQSVSHTNSTDADRMMLPLLLVLKCAWCQGTLTMLHGCAAGAAHAARLLLLHPHSTAQPGPKHGTTSLKTAQQGRQTAAHSRRLLLKTAVH
jgi:hypothetical protein